MKHKKLSFLGLIGTLMLAMSAVGQTPTQTKFSGVINDYTPASINGSAVGPWEVRGPWTLVLRGDSGTADFSAALTMVHSDLGTSDLNSSKARNAHTHHITLTGATVTQTPNGFQLSNGDLVITANGKNPPPFGANSTLHIDITGSNTVTFSNIQVTFGGDAAGHFGSQAVNGVVRNFK